MISTKVIDAGLLTKADPWPVLAETLLDMNPVWGVSSWFSPKEDRMVAFSLLRTAPWFLAASAALALGCGSSGDQGMDGTGGIVGDGGSGGTGATGGPGGMSGSGGTDGTGGTGGTDGMDPSCEGVDCTSQSDCVSDGACDPATGQCVPGDNVAQGEPCDFLGLGDGFCDGAGTCVECNDALDCGDAPQCLVPTCLDGTCGEEAGPDDVMCDLLGIDDGVCLLGECVERPECNSDAECDNSNICTIDTCLPNNECNFEPNDGVACDLIGTGDGMCEGAVCVECLISADCDDDNICTIDTCLPNNECNFEPNDGESCDLVGAGDGICDGGVCVEPPTECVIDADCQYEQTCEDNTCIGPKVVFREDFESGIGRWSADNGVWDVGAPTVGPTACDEGTQCAGTVLDGNYPPAFRSTSALISPTIVLPAVSGNEEVHLRFRQWFHFDQPGDGDRGQVQIQVKDAGGTFGAWIDVGAAVAGSSGDWSLKDVDLTAYAGETVRIGFRLESLDQSGGGFPGWYIDDVEIMKF